MFHKIPGVSLLLIGALALTGTARAEEGSDEARPWGPAPPVSSEPEGVEAAEDEVPAPEPEQPEVQVEATTPEAESAEPATAEEAEPRGLQLGGSSRLLPFIIVVGGMNYHHFTADEEDRFVTVAMTRFGLEGQFGEHVSLRSELEINAGPHGTSVWEGQAAMSILDQYIRLSFNWFQLNAGRITDEASIDYFSTHVANLLLTDPYVRTPFLYSGANRGNGIRVRAEVYDGLKLGFTVNAGNPLAFTGTSMFGGTFGILPRFYFEPQRSVSEDAQTFPSDQYYVILVSPSISYEFEYLRAQFSYQYMLVDVTRQNEDNPMARGHNFRGGVQGLFWDGRIRPFVNFSYLTNHTFDRNEANQPIIDPLSQELFQGITLGAGIDVDFLGNTGIGIQYNMVREQRADPDAEVGGPIVYNHFLNIGASWWFHTNVCVEARYALWLRCEDQGSGMACDASSEGSTAVQEHNIFLTLRGVFGVGQAQRAAQSL
jgi:hypothetical protein